MELFALFDDDVIRGSPALTYSILSVWSLSFLQFVPVLYHQGSFRSMTGEKHGWITRNCGSYFAEVVITAMAISMQDGPFLIMRVYIIVGFNFVSYSLVFFLIKNIVVIILLLYRMTILCVKLPCCYRTQTVFVEPISLDLKEVEYQVSTA
jgi:hypothetical protein